VVTVPTPVTQPVTTPVTTPTVTPANNGRWSSPQTKTWKGAAAKQALRVQKGKPPWAGPKKNQQTTTPTATVPAAVPAAVPDTSSTPPGQTKTPPGQEKKAKSPHG
jgi:hypothetical protein